MTWIEYLRRKYISLFYFIFYIWHFLPSSILIFSIYSSISSSSYTSLSLSLSYCFESLIKNMEKQQQLSIVLLCMMLAFLSSVNSLSFISGPLESPSLCESSELYAFCGLLILFKHLKIIWSYKNRLKKYESLIIR